MPWSEAISQPQSHPISRWFFTLIGSVVQTSHCQPYLMTLESYVSSVKQPMFDLPNTTIIFSDGKMIFRCSPDHLLILMIQAKSSFSILFPWFLKPKHAFPWILRFKPPFLNMDEPHLRGVCLWCHRVARSEAAGPWSYSPHEWFYLPMDIPMKWLDFPWYSHEMVDIPMKWLFPWYLQKNIEKSEKMLQLP